MLQTRHSIVSIIIVTVMRLSLLVGGEMMEGFKIEYIWITAEIRAIVAGKNRGINMNRITDNTKQ